MSRTVPSVVVAAAIAAVAIGFGNALMDLATVAGGAALAWWGFSHYQAKVSDLKSQLAASEKHLADTRAQMEASRRLVPRQDDGAWQDFPPTATSAPAHATGRKSGFFRGR